MYIIFIMNMSFHNENNVDVQLILKRERQAGEGRCHLVGTFGQNFFGLGVPILFRTYSLFGSSLLRD